MRSRKLAERAIVITGAGRGLGRAYTLEAAAEGADLVVNDIDVDAATETAGLVEDLGARAAVSGHSVSDESGAAAIIDLCLESYDSIDGLVNNAGLFSVGDPWEETAATSRQLVEVNVLGTILCGIAAMSAMVQQHHGVIVNVTSGAHLGLGGMSTYGATKGAVASLTYCWAEDLAGTGVRVCGLSPVATTRMTTLLGQRDAPVGQDPAGVAPLVTYLLSNEAAATHGRIVRIINSEVSLLDHGRFTPPVPVGDRPMKDVVAALLADRDTDRATRARP